MKRIKKLKEKLVRATGKERINLLNEISSIYSRLDLEECQEYARMALKLSKELNFYDGKATSLKNLALYYFFEGNYATSRFYLNDAIVIAKKTENKNILAEIYSFYGTMLRETGEFEESYKKCMLAYNLYQEIKDNVGMANTLNILGILHKLKNDNKKALEYYKKALIIACRINDSEIIGTIRSNIGTIYRLVGKYENAMEFFNKAIDYFRYTDNKLSVANTLNNMALTYSSQKEYEKAKEFIEKAHILFKELNNKNGLVLSEYNLADIYAKMHEYEKAEEIFLEVIKFYLKTHNIQMLKYSYFSMYELTKEWGKIEKALQYYEKFHDIEMKMLSEKERKNIAELEAKFELLQKDKQIEQIKQNNIELEHINKTDKFILKKLQKNNAFYELILENSYRATMILSELKIIYANKHLYKIFEIEGENITTLNDIFDNKTVKEMISYKESIVSMEKITETYNMETTTIKGKKQNIRITISHFKNNDNNWLFLIQIEDITELHKKEERLRLLMRAFEQSPTSIAITDVSGNLRYVNPKFTKLTGYSSEEVIGNNPRILKSNKSKTHYNKLWKTISSGKDWHGIFYNKRKDGKSYWEQANISPVWDKFGNITHYIKIAEDITEKKKAEDKIQNLLVELKRANTSKDKFFSIIAHDLKSPFATLSAFVNIMKHYYDRYSKEKIMQMIDELDKGVKNTYALLENLLTWSRMQSGGMEYNPMNFNLTPIIVKIIGLYKQKSEQKGISLEYDIPEETRIYADMFMIETTIRNLVNNALKFTPQNGKISVGLKDSDGFYTVFVKDTGVGISEENIKNLFNINTSFSTYGTNNEKGTGLGLILCKDFIEQNKGEIWVENQEDKGTIFYLTIPKAKK